MPSRAIAKFTQLGELESWPNAAGIGIIGGIPYLNIDGAIAPIGGAPLAVGKTVRVVDPDNADSTNDIYETITAALADAVAGDVILIAPGEYNEDVEITLQFIRLIGVGAQNSVRITGTAAGTSTALKINGASDVGIYNLNLEGRSGGSGLNLTGQIRRFSIVGCKVHGGTQAILLSSPGGGQLVDCRFVGLTIANAATGVFMDYSGGDPCHQLKFLGCIFEKITTDCIKEDGATHDWLIDGCLFGLVDGVEATRILDIDAVGTTGMVSNNTFGTTLQASGKLAIASGVIYINNRTEQEQPGTDAYAASGRPDA